MNKISQIFSVLVAVILLSNFALQGQTLVDQWGLSAEYNTLWPILNDAGTPAGSASMSGEAMSGWRALQGGFAEMTITTDNAIVVKGKMEFIGGAPPEAAYTPLRYALTWQDSNTTLVNALTDSATWSHQGNHFGYGFHPRTGAGTTSNGAGGSGNVWTINNGNWASTWSNGGWPVTKVNQAPRNADMVEGVYDFAISVISVDDTTNEISWYLVEENQKYWFGGTARDTAMTKKFNSILFGTDQFEGTEFRVIAAEVKKGAPVEVPEAPWEDYYVDQWGLSAEYNSLWPILNDTLTLVGDASMGGEALSGWRALQGGFGQDVTISKDKAIIVEGQLEYFGGAPPEAAYTPLRYALTWQDSNTTLVNALTDSATWSHQGNHFGYGFHPRTGAGTTSNGAGGSGNVWTINNGNWASTWSNGGWPVTKVNQAPRNADMVEGVYNFAISVIAIDDITNEISWYLVEDADIPRYWFGGTARDTAMTTKFNSIIFGTDQFEGTELRLIEVKVKKGTSIEVPKAPWEDFYVDTWGIYGGNNGGWNLTPGEFTGNVDFTGTTTPTGMAVVRADLGLVSPTADEDIFLLEGSIELAGGGFEGANSLMFGLFQGDNAGSLDSLEDGYNWNGTDDGNTGYLMLPQEGSNGAQAWSDGNGFMGKISNDVWSNFAAGNVLGDLAPLQTTGGAGTYDFKINIVPKSDGTLIQWNLGKDDGSYYMEGAAIDAAPVTSFNSFVVGIGEGASATSLLIRDLKASMVDDPIVLDVEKLTSVIPTSFELGQNYPNPFNPSTKIEFAIPKDSDVKIAVYDILGAQVAELVNGEFKAGFYNVNFNATNLASGIYFYSIKASDFTSTKKLVLLK